MTFWSSFPPLLNSPARIRSHPVAFPFFNLLIAISMSTPFGGSTYGSGFVRTLSASLRCNCTFHLAIQRASRNIHITFVGPPLHCSLVPSLSLCVMFVV